MDIKSVDSMPGLRSLGPRGIMRRRIGMFGEIRELIVMAKDNPQIIGRPFSKVNRHIFFDFCHTLPLLFFEHKFQ